MLKRPPGANIPTPCCNISLYFVPWVCLSLMSDILRQHISRIAPLSDAEFEQLLGHFKPLSFKKGQVVLSEGHSVDTEYFVLSGCLKAFYINSDDKMFILQFAMREWWTCDYHALYRQTRSTITIDCVADCEVLSISNEARERLCAGMHKAEHFFRIRTNNGYVALQKRLLSFMNNDTRARYEELIKQYPQLLQLVPKHLIAAYLGVSRETLSRLYAS